MFQLLQRFNPTASLLRMKSFVSRHDYIFSLLCLLNVNMGKPTKSYKASFNDR
jgi:formate-dependent nitrite reductase membrane component NrfD